MSGLLEREKSLVAYRECLDSIDLYLDLLEDDETAENISIAILAKIDKLNGTLRGIGL